ncbi:hypothetical protein [Parasphingorhabdus sp. NYA22]
MNNRDSSNLAKKLEAITKRKFGSLDLEFVSPDQAAALRKQKLLNADDMAALAGFWLDQGLDSGSSELAVLALDKPSELSDAGLIFDAALRELGVRFPNAETSLLKSVHIYLDAIVNNRISPMAGMAALDDLHRDHYDSGGRPLSEALVCHPNRNVDDPTRYAGQELGLEYLFTWYREFQDSQDMGGSTWYYNELPFEQQLAKFDEELVAEAKILLEHLNTVHPDIIGSTELP